MLHVKGESMINAGIFDGDKVLVQKQSTAENGDFVVAMVEDGVTVKTFYRENGHVLPGRGEYTHSSQGFPSANARMRWSANRLPHRFRALTADIPG